MLRQNTRSMALNVEVIKDLINVVSSSDITELSIECEELSLKIKRERKVDYRENVSPAETPPATATTPRREEGAVYERKEGEGTNDREEKRYVTITSPMVGTFYRAPSPGAKSFVEVGDYVKPGDTVCIIEAMKLMNEIEAETEGQIVKILVENAQPVEYGQPLFILEKV